MSKQETIQHLTGLMATIQNAYYKKGLFEPLEYDSRSRIRGELRVHESNDCGISIDLYNFDGDGRPVCDGLMPCKIIYDDESTDIGQLFCMCYDPDNENETLVFLLSHDEWGDGGDIEIAPESVPDGTLHNIIRWLESVFNEVRSRSMNDVTSYFFYMWNRWSREECEIVFKDSDYNHFWNKWCEAYDLANGPRGAAEIFYMMLSNDNRDKLVKRALKCYDGTKDKDGNK